MKEEVTEHQFRALLLCAMGIPFVGVLQSVAYLHDGREKHGAVAANDE